MKLNHWFSYTLQNAYHAEFDKYSQTYNMIIEDFNGRQVTVSAQYRAETKKFIELLEKNGKINARKSRKGLCYSRLCIYN